MAIAGDSAFPRRAFFSKYFRCAVGVLCGGFDRRLQTLNCHCLVGCNAVLRFASRAAEAPTAILPRFLHQFSNRMQKVVEHGFLGAFGKIFGNHSVQVRSANLGERLYQFFMDVRRCRQAPELRFLL